ncbi:hypothetical protein LCGC14_0598240 [marine sediment metagenome]|uniref:Uncharacterized protein n=1 Tax=marine sediment metagenome TaxID=412755 RepID=A0A0F9RBI5_9ZZZZ
MITYKATGIVLGNNWGGGISGYPANEINANSLRELREEIEEQLESGSLDSGMGYQSLIGAIMTIDTTDSREIDGKVFISHDYEDEIFGDVTPEQEEWLMDAKFNS